MIRDGWRLVWTGLFLAAGIGAAAAQSDVCQSLAGQLARIDRAGGAVDPLSDALIRQREALQRGIADYQRRCQVGFFSSPSPQCPAIQARLAEMQSNLDKLEQRARGSRPQNPTGFGEDRARILTAMRQAGCSPGAATAAAGPVPPGTIAARSGQPAVNGSQPIVAGGRRADGYRYFTLQGPQGPVTYREDDNGRVTRVDAMPAARVAAVPPARGPGGFFGGIFGERPPGVYPDDPYASGEGEGAEPADLDEGGAFRTLCVRTCDGYYFPISYSTSRARFGTDAEICRARCPGAETRLFAHRTGEDSETAVSADDGQTPYTKMPNALRYRTEVVSGCGCGRPDPTLLPVNASSEEGASSGSSTVRVGDIRNDLPIPRAKPEPDEDPDTRLNALAAFAPAPVQHVKPADEGAKSGPKSVRVIGPKFFANQ